MALINLPPGNVLVPWIGPATTLAGLPWFTAANVGAVYRVSANRLGYISSIPGEAFPGFTQVLPTAAGQVPDAYIFVVKAGFALDDTLIGQPVPVPPRLVGVFPANATAFVLALGPLEADQAGSYILDPARPATGLANLSYAKNGTAVTLSTTVAVVLATGDTLAVTGTTATGATGRISLIKQ